MSYNDPVQQTSAIADSKAVREYLTRVRAALRGVPPEAVEDLMSRAMAEIELEAATRYVDLQEPEDAAAMLARFGPPEEMADRLRETLGAGGRTSDISILLPCRACRREVSAQAVTCPHCGAPYPARKTWSGWGYEWRSNAEFRGWPLVHIAFGRDQHGKRRVARGIIAIGQFGIGAVTVAQFGVGFVFGLGQFVIAPLAVGQFALGLLAAGQFGIGILAGAGQIATGIFSAGMKAFGVWTRSSL